ncbi:MAG: hypothetical protein DRQ49_13695 [Gammaproteobacteria bacterium]|nr:MAG: hypothetical protein DRQ49_13695 [Gammaproteobacteria bacterium]RKZ39342.1 MAG: hypothetical protein DRQ41_10715 [Gammaproteobacteria bacterium]
MKSKKWPFNSNVGLSTLGIIVGVMVLILTLVIYDGYVKKMETIIFSLFPQISVKSTSGLLDGDKDDDSEPMFEPKSLFVEIHKTEMTMDEADNVINQLKAHYSQIERIEAALYDTVRL